MEYLPIPLITDSLSEMARKLSALAEAVRQDKSIAAVTRYAASITQERESTNSAISDMHPLEYEAWGQYTAGKYPLPELDWNSNIEPAPTSAKPLRTARRRAEALNRLYNTEKADTGHSVWFAKHEICHLPLVKAMARIIGADRNLFGGQYAINASLIADFQTINRILTISTEALKSLAGNPIPVDILSAQQVLNVHRDKLREKLTNNSRMKRKRRMSPQ
jgi:hypothetical protein